MPVYEYECLRCGSRFAKYVGTAGEDNTVCPDCDSSSIKRIMSAPGGFRGTPTPDFHGVPREEDEVFNKEWDEIWKDDPLVDSEGE